jgi:hypothetical protein
MNKEEELSEIVKRFIIPFFSIARKKEAYSFGAKGTKESYVSFPDMTEELYNIIVEKMKECV